MQPVIKTINLTLRPFVLSDSERVALLAGEKRIADMTANIPHPYEPPMAEQWISGHESNFSANLGITCAITRNNEQDLVGAVSLMHHKEGSVVLGYWLGVDYWGNGITYEAAKALIEFGKSHFSLREVTVMHLVDNYQSQRVIEKLGFKYTKNTFLGVRGEQRELKNYLLEF